MTCKLRRPGFCERSKFEDLVCQLDTDKKVKNLMSFLNKNFPKAMQSDSKVDAEFEYCRLGFDELRLVNEFLGETSE